MPPDTAADTLAAWWEAAEVSTQRAVAALVLSPDVLGTMTVIQAPVPGVKVPARDGCG